MRRRSNGRPAKPFTGSGAPPPGRGETPAHVLLLEGRQARATTRATTEMHRELNLGLQTRHSPGQLRIELNTLSRDRLNATDRFVKFKTLVGYESVFSREEES